jgi:type I restriction enzyme M protein
MSNGDLGWITNFIWGIAADVLRDLYVRGKYRDVILPMTVLRGEGNRGAAGTDRGAAAG